MKNFLKNIGLLVLILIASYFTTSYVGNWYNTFVPQHGSWAVSRNDEIFFAGMLLSYIIFIPFLFELFGSGNKIKWILWLILPVVLLLLLANASGIYIPIVLSIIAFGLAKLLLFIKSKF